jgi:hypothetical protein
MKNFRSTDKAEILAAHLYLLAVRNAGQSSLSLPSAGLGWQGPGDDTMLRGWTRLSLAEREEFIVVAKSILLHLSACEASSASPISPERFRARMERLDFDKERLRDEQMDDAGLATREEGAPAREEGAPSAPILAPCPTCEGRKAGLFDSLCKKHFEELERPSAEAIEEAMEKGRKAAEAYRKSSRSGWRVW